MRIIWSSADREIRCDAGDWLRFPVHSLRANVSEVDTLPQFTRYTVTVEIDVRHEYEDSTGALYYDEPKPEDMEPDITYRDIGPAYSGKDLEKQISRLLSKVDGDYSVETTDSVVLDENEAFCNQPWFRRSHNAR